MIGDWYLHHRTSDELRGLAIQSGFLAENIRVGSKTENVNLFLHLTR